LKTGVDLDSACANCLIRAAVPVEQPERKSTGTARWWRRLKIRNAGDDVETRAKKAAAPATVE